MLRIQKRTALPVWKSWLIRAIAIIIALVLNGVLIYGLTKMNPVKVYATMFNGVFGSERRIWNTIRDISMLLCIGIGLAPAFKMKFWNIGAEGQVLIGALSTAIVMVNFSTLSTPLLFTLMIVSSVVMGAIWGLIPAIFKAKWNVNETLFTLMMNYVAMQLVDYYYNIWKGSKASLGMLNPGTKAGYLPEYNGSSNNIIVTVVLIITVLMYIYLKKEMLV